MVKPEYWKVADAQVVEKTGKPRTARRR